MLDKDEARRKHIEDVEKNLVHSLQGVQIRMNTQDQNNAEQFNRIDERMKRQEEEIVDHARILKQLQEKPKENTSPGRRRRGVCRGPS